MINTKSDTFRQEVIEITPEMAKQFLRMNSNNRATREEYVRQYAQMMTDGHWDLSHEGIAFYKDGSLADGQHRLLAIVRSGKTIRMCVTYGLERSMHINVGLRRTMTDSIRIADPSMAWVKPPHQAWAKLLNSEFPGIGCGKDTEKFSEYLKRYRHSYEWVYNTYRPGQESGLRTAGVYAAFVCAHMAGEDVEKLARAASYLASGLVDVEYNDPAVNTIMMLRKTLTSGSLQKGRLPGKRMQRDILLCTGLALKNYINGARKTKCEVPHSFSFPVYGLDGSVVYNPAN